MLVDLALWAAIVGAPPQQPEEAQAPPRPATQQQALPLDSGRYRPWPGLPRQTDPRDRYRPWGGLDRNGPYRPRPRDGK